MIWTRNEKIIITYTKQIWTANTLYLCTHKPRWQNADDRRSVLAPASHSPFLRSHQTSHRLERNGGLNRLDSMNLGQSVADRWPNVVTACAWINNTYFLLLFFFFQIYHIVFQEYVFDFIHDKKKTFHTLVSHLQIVVFFSPYTPWYYFYLY